MNLKKTQMHTMTWFGSRWDHFCKYVNRRRSIDIIFANMSKHAVILTSCMQVYKTNAVELTLFLQIPQTELALRGSYGVGKEGAMICGRTRARLPRSPNH